MDKQAERLFRGILRSSGHCVPNCSCHDLGRCRDVESDEARVVTFVISISRGNRRLGFWIENGVYGCSLRTYVISLRTSAFKAISTRQCQAGNHLFRIGFVGAGRCKRPRGCVAARQAAMRDSPLGPRRIGRGQASVFDQLGYASASARGALTSRDTKGVSLAIQAKSCAALNSHGSEHN